MDVKAHFTELASSIEKSSHLLGDWYSQPSTQQLSNEKFGQTSRNLDPLKLPDEIRRAKKTLLEATWELQGLSAEPLDFLAQHRINRSFIPILTKVCAQNQQLSCLRWLVHFEILKHIPLTENGSRWEDVATSAKVPLSQLRSVALMAATNNFLRVVQPERIAHSRISAQFVRYPQYLDWADWATSYSAPTAHAFTDATQRWGDTNAKNETAFNVAFGTELPFFDHVAASTDLSAVFANYMRSRNRSEELALEHVLLGFDWAKLGRANIVDVGGSTGQASLLLLNRFRELQCTVQDLPSTLQNSSEILSTLDPPVASRLNFVAHNFFEPQPKDTADNADIFFLRRILHDWPDAEAITILQHLATALTKNDARILIMDTILPVPGNEAPLSEATLRATDLTMRQMFNSREREIEDWTRLFESTTPKLKLQGYKLPMGSALAVMEVVRL